MKFLLIFLIFFSQTVLAEDWRINDQHTQIQFEVGYMGVMEVTGLFTKTRGKFHYDPKTKIASNIDLQISSKSVQTHNKKRDSHLRRQDFLAVATYPWIEFKLVRVDLSPGTKEIHGLLTLRGVTKDIPLLLKAEGLHPDPWDENKSSLFLHVEGKIKRSDFGLVWNKTLDQGGVLVSDTVTFSVDVEANPSDQKLAFSRFYVPNGVKHSPMPTENDEGDKNLQKEKAISHETYRPTEADVDNDEPTPIKLSPKDSSNPASVAIGFIIFVIITAISIWFKIFLQKMLKDKTKWSPIVNEITSDVILLAFVIAAFTMTAPLMGYGN